MFLATDSWPRPVAIRADPPQMTSRTASVRARSSRPERSFQVCSRDSFVSSFSILIFIQRITRTINSIFATNALHTVLRSHPIETHLLEVPRSQDGPPTASDPQDRPRANRPPSLTMHRWSNEIAHCPFAAQEFERAVSSPSASSPLADIETLGCEVGPPESGFGQIANHFAASSSD